MQTALPVQRTYIAKSRGIGFILSTYSETRWVQWVPVSHANALRGAVLAYGQPVELAPKLDAADIILAIDSDLLSSAPGHLRFARDFSLRRNPVRTKKMSRIYAIEPTPTLIGAVAEHRFIAGPHELHQIIMAEAAKLLGDHPLRKCRAGCAR